jgi:hypothetical protein
MKMKDARRIEDPPRAKQQVVLFSPLPGLCVEHQVEEATRLPDRWGVDRPDAVMCGRVLTWVAFNEPVIIQCGLIARCRGGRESTP